MSEYPCELSAGRPHDTTLPAAVVEAVLEWETSDGQLMRRVRRLCRPCLDDKIEETTEHARKGEHSILKIQAHYVADATLPRKGKTIGRAMARRSRQELYAARKQ